MARWARKGKTVQGPSQHFPARKAFASLQKEKVKRTFPLHLCFNQFLSETDLKKLSPEAHPSIGQPSRLGRIVVFR